MELWFVLKKIMKNLNIVINPVERWFHFTKPLPIEMPQEPVMHIWKDLNGDDVPVFFGEWGKIELL